MEVCVQKATFQMVTILKEFFMHLKSVNGISSLMTILKSYSLLLFQT